MFIHKKDDPRCAPLWKTLDKQFDEAIVRANVVIIEFFAELESSVQNNSLTNDIFRYNYSGKKEE
jgi:hypothetical protein